MKVPHQQRDAHQTRNHWVTRALLLCIFSSILGLSVIPAALADGRDQAKRMHDRLAGIPPTEEVLCEMASLINAGRPLEAADIVMNTGTVSAAGLDVTCDTGGDDVIDNSASKKAFYTVSLKNFVTPWTNVEQTTYAPLNDYTATVIGIIRDDADFKEVLTGNYIYKGTGSYSTTDNSHYETLESSNADLSDSGVLTQVTQASVGLPGDAEDRGGVTTTRAAGKAFFSAGTNRRMFRFTLMNYMCRDLEQVKDTSRVPDRIRQDVSRSPGGDSSLFLNSCIGCHTGMDPMAGAYAYYEWTENEDGSNGQLVYNRTIVHNPSADPAVKHKYLINASTFPNGYITTDNSWKNYWRAGPNSALGWANNTDGSVTSGVGINTMNAEIANSETFAQCQVEKVYTHVCLESPDDDVQSALSAIKDSFMGNYNLKNVFAATADLCKGS